ncbi:DNA topoisomerase IB [Janibacter anophelis]|uniref:DNA topoisomerase IB n=1 Tax=Janibacter anophelis TaxID=319054 RepID=UPI000DEF7871|nr:DNA topoisomerase IB [Janibacter anophelis]
MRHSSPDEPGITRRRRGRGFSHHLPSGRLVDDATRARIDELAVPPVWQDVWICTDPDAHLLATGVDEAGRTQYLYHPRWRAARDREKFDRALELAPRLPGMRRRLREDLRGRGASRARVTAVALWLLDTGRLRVGSTAYEQEHGSHGVTTLLVEHVHDRGDGVCLEFPAKGGQLASVAVTDEDVVGALRALRRAGRPGDHLLRHGDASARQDLGAGALAEHFVELVGEGFSVKDLRTWAATVTAAESLARSARAGEDDEEAVRTAIDAAADSLGDTATVARDSYVDPRVLDAHREGRRVRPTRGTPLEHSDEVRRRVERELVALLGGGRMSR